MENRLIRLCVVGAGGHSSEVHAPALMKLQEEGVISLAGVCDLSADRAETYRKRFGFKSAYTDIGGMIRSEQPDGILAITSIRDTEAVAGELIPYQIPLLIEKPPGSNAAAAGRLLAASKRYQTPIMVSLNRRFNPALMKALRWFSDRGLRPDLIEARMFRSDRLPDKFVSQTGIHLIDAALSLMGDPGQVHLHVSHNGMSGRNVAAAFLEDEEGHSCQLLLAPRSGCNEETYTLTARKFSVSVDAIRQCARAYDDTDGRVEEWHLDGVEYHEHKLLDVEAETRAFVSGIIHHERFTPDIAIAERSYRLAEAIETGLCGREFETGFPPVTLPANPTLAPGPL